MVVYVVSEGVGAKKDADEPTPYSYPQWKTLHLKKGYADGPVSKAVLRLIETHNDCDLCRLQPLAAGAVAMAAPSPTAGPTLAILQLLLGPANAAFSGLLPLGILDPTDELVACQRRDVLPSIECRGVGGQRRAQVCR